MAVDGAGRALVSTPPGAGAGAGGSGSWSEAFAIRGAGALTSVSCASASLCVAVDGEGKAALSTEPGVAGSGSWSEAFVIRGAGALTSVSCASASLCVAVDGEGRVAVSTSPGVAGPGAWSEATAIPGVNALSSVSCSSVSLCAAVGNEGKVLVSTEPAAGASAWHTRLIDPSLGLISVSCFAGDSCVAIDGAGEAFASANVAAPLGAGGAPGSGATWSSTAFDLFGAPTALSCTAAGLCVAVDGSGYAFASADPTAAPPAWAASPIDTQPPAPGLRGVSCVAEGAGLCAAVDAAGRVIAGAIPAPPPPPVEATLVPPHPSISGTPAIGQTLTCHTGVSAGASPGGVAFAYAWLRNTRTIPGAAGASYTVAGADVSTHVQCRVTATTAAGSESASSGFVTVPAGGLGAVSETSVGAPRAGRAAVSVPLVCSAQAAGSCTIKLALSVQETLSGNRIVALAAKSPSTRRLTVAVGARTVRLRPSQRYTATVALNSTGRSLLARAHRLAVRLSVSGTVVGVLNAALKSATVTFGAALPAKRSRARGGGSAAEVRGAKTPVRGARVLARRTKAHAGVDAIAAGGATPASILAPTPYMGWDTYFTFGGHYDEAAVLEQASELIARGLARRGYDLVWLDAGWWQGTRGPHGEIEVSPSQWPHGMAWLTSTLHAAGLKVGIYTDAGNSGCGSPAGSYGHYQQDVNTFAAWGFDAVKVDFCGGVRMGLAPAAAYGAFHQAIVHNAGRRPMLLSICDFLQPGQFAPEDPAIENSAFTSYTFGPSSGNSWRTDTDVGIPGEVPFGSVLRNLDADAAQPQAAGPGHWNDPDYLGPDQGMSAAQFRTQFSMWAMLAAPMMVSADLISLSNQSAATIDNREAIAIDQDPAGVQAHLLSVSGNGQVWVKPLSDGSRAVALLNRSAGTIHIATTAVAVGMASANEYALRNIWSGATTDVGPVGPIAANVPGDSTVLLRVFTKHGRAK